MNENPYAPPPDSAAETAASETQFSTAVLWTLVFGIGCVAGLSVLTDLPSFASPFPILSLTLREMFDVPRLLIPVIVAGIFALVHIRQIIGRPRQQSNTAWTVTLAIMTGLSVPYFYVEFSLGLAVRGLTHTLLVSAYNMMFAIATWWAWFRSRAPGRYRAQVAFSSLLFVWMFWCWIPYLGEV